MSGATHDSSAIISEVILQLCAACSMAYDISHCLECVMEHLTGTRAFEERALTQ